MNKYYVTDNQIKEAKNMLRNNGIKFMTCNNPIANPEDMKLINEIYAVEMIHSFIAYHDWSTKDEWVNNRYLIKYRDMFGESHLKELINETLKMVKTIKRNVLKDSDGISYNAIIWVDDKEEK